MHYLRIHYTILLNIIPKIYYTLFIFIIHYKKTYIKHYYEKYNT